MPHIGQIPLRGRVTDVVQERWRASILRTGFSLNERITGQTIQKGENTRKKVELGEK